MASSIFLIDYADGQPTISFDEITAFDAETETFYGGWSVLEEVIDPNQADVRMLLTSSKEILTTLKEDNRFTWVEDVEGWTE